MQQKNIPPAKDKTSLLKDSIPDRGICLGGARLKGIFLFDDSKFAKHRNMDIIADFDAGQDYVWLDNSTLGKLGASSMTKAKKIDASFFTVGLKTKDVNDYVTYGKQKGFLIDDADPGAKTVVIFAKMSKDLKMKHYDMFVA